MKREKWNLLGNMFEIKTRGSFKKTLTFSERHYNALKGENSDPYIVNVFNGYAPVYENFIQAYTNWTSLSGIHKGASQDLFQTLLAIGTPLKQWEGKIFFHYPEGSEQATAIFPHKRTPFYKGNCILRTNAVELLAEQLGNFPALAAVKADVDTYYLQLKSKLEKYKLTEGQLAMHSTELENQRKEVTNAMYGNLGLLMYHFRHTPRLLNVFFDMGVIKNKVRRKKRVNTKKANAKKGNL